MNKERRKEATEAVKKLDAAFKAASPALEALKQALEDCKSTLESVHDEEVEARDALPDSLQNGERGEAMQVSIDALFSAYEKCTEVIEAAESIDQEFEQIENSVTEACEA